MLSVLPTPDLPSPSSGVYQGLEQAFMNRCRCFRIDPDLAVWKRHAVKSGVNPSVIAYFFFHGH